MLKTAISFLLLILCACAFAKGDKQMDKSPKSISSALDKAHIYIMPQPREISWGKGKCDLRKARGIVFY